MGLIDRYIDFLGEPWLARLSVTAANIWRGVPFVAISLLAGLQTIPPSLYEASSIDGATPWQQFWNVTLPLLTPIIAVVMTSACCSRSRISSSSTCSRAAGRSTPLT